jgi:pyruvate formate lyase activating enzyme
MRAGDEDLHKGTIFNIQKYCIHDGPGIRTTVFLKGCPLNCWWCHNPESQLSKPEIMFWSSRCKQCGFCIKRCPQEAIEIVDGVLKTDKEKCILCGKCTDFCPYNAREIAGKEFSVHELMKEIKKDIVFYEESGGGVTFSGGEPMCQIHFLNDLLDACNNKEIHTAVDTCGYTSWDNYKMIADKVDLFLFDIKHMNSEMHKKYTGVPNELILDNIKKLSDLGKNIFIRMPIIPGVNDDKKNSLQAIEFLNKLKIQQVNLLPYHKIGMDKYKRMNKKYMVSDVSEPSNEKMTEISEIFSKAGIKVKIGG